MNKMPIVVVTFAAFAFATHASRMPSYSVSVAAPRMRRIVEQQQFVDACGKESLACTHILGESFHASCESSRARVEISFVPYIYLNARSSAWTLGHELAHIDDLRQSIEMYARQLSETDFQSQQDCDDALIAERLSFEERFRRFATESQQSRR